MRSGVVRLIADSEPSWDETPAKRPWPATLGAKTPGACSRRLGAASAFQRSPGAPRQLPEGLFHAAQNLYTMSRDENMGIKGSSSALAPDCRLPASPQRARNLCQQAVGGGLGICDGRGHLSS